MGGKSKSQTVGYRYYMSMHMALCYGPIDSMLQIRAGDRTAWSGSVTASGTIGIESPDLFGGDEREGGVVGLLDVMMGEPTQAPNTYLTNKIGPNRPGYRGLFTTVFHGGHSSGVPFGGLAALLMNYFGLVINKGGGLITSNNPYIKPWAYQLRRTKKGWTSDNCWYSEKAEILISGSVTPSSALYEREYSLNNAIGGFHSFPLTSGSITVTSGPQLLFTGYKGENSNPYLARSILRLLSGDVLYDTGWYGQEPSAGYLVSALTAAGRTDLIGPITPSQSVSSIVPLEPGSYGFTHECYYVQQSSPLQGRPRLKIYTAGSDSRMLAMNPAHIVYQCLTDPEWGMGYDASIIEDASFRTAANTFHGEGLGLCLQWARQDGIDNFIQLVLDHAGACLVEDRRTLLWKLIPIRGNYDPETLPHFSDTPTTGQFRILELTRFERSALTDATNELTVSYTDVVTGKNGSVTVQNLAAVQAAGRVISQSRDYLGLPTSSLAVRTAMRDLRAATSGLAKVQLVLDRNGYDLLPGSVIRWSWSPDGIVGMVLRIVSIDYGSLTDGRVRVECVEDVFGLPATTYAQVPPIGWQEPNTSAQPSPAVAAFEAPFRELIQTIGRSETLALPQDSGYVGAVAARAPGVNINFRLYTTTGTDPYQDTGVADWTPTGTLTADIGPQATSIALTAADDLDVVLVGGTGMLGSDPYSAEIVRIDGIDVGAGTLTIARGCLDTTPKPWPAGTRFWGYDDYTASATTEYTDGESVSCKMLTNSSTELLSEGLAPTAAVTMASRAARPYPPGKLRVTDTVASNVAYPAECIGALTLSWAHRDRLLQDDRVIDAEESSIGPEPGTTYTVRFYLDNVLDSTQTGISGTSSAPYTLTGSGIARVEVWAVRDGLESWQAAQASFTYYTNPYNTRISDDGDTRVTDAGETRVTE